MGGPASRRAAHRARHRARGNSALTPPNRRDTLAATLCSATTLYAPPTRSSLSPCGTTPSAGRTTPPSTTRAPFSYRRGSRRARTAASSPCSKNTSSAPRACRRAHSLRSRDCRPSAASLTTTRRNVSSRSGRARRSRRRTRSSTNRGSYFDRSAFSTPDTTRGVSRSGRAAGRRVDPRRGARGRRRGARSDRRAPRRTRGLRGVGGVARWSRIVARHRGLFRRECDSFARDRGCLSRPRGLSARHRDLRARRRDPVARHGGPLARHSDPSARHRGLGAPQSSRIAWSSPYIARRSVGEARDPRYPRRNLVRPSVRLPRGAARPDPLVCSAAWFIMRAA
jgi:hypothetical protein